MALENKPERFIVRDSRISDLGAIQSIYADEVLHGVATFEEVAPDAHALGLRRQEVLDGGFFHLVAERQGTVVGFAYTGPHRPRPAYRYTVEDSVYVAKGHRGEGIGKLLLDALIKRCDGGIWRQMVAVIGDTANTGSIRLHEGLGFRKVGVLSSVGFKHGRWVDTVIMQRPLNEGDGTQPV